MPTPKRNEKQLERLVRYLKRPRTIVNIAQRFCITERTAYRWLNYLREQDFCIVTFKNRNNVIVHINYGLVVS